MNICGRDNSESGPSERGDALSASKISNTLSNSMLPPKSTTSNKIMVEILKQELLSCKRQLKDQQSSNQFLKKEKLKVEHQKNMLEIKI